MNRAWLVVALLFAPAIAAADPLKLEDQCRPDARFDKPTLSQQGTKGLGDGLLGKTASQVIAKRGQPGCRSAALWRYWVPAGCAYEKVVVSVWFQNGGVSRVVAVKWVTGQECM